MNQTVTRTISGVLFLVIMVCGLIFNQYIYAALLIAMMVIMMLEFYSLTMEGRFKVSRGFAIFAGVTLFTLMFSVIPGTPGRRQQMPRMNSSTFTPA